MEEIAKAIASKLDELWEAYNESKSTPSRRFLPQDLLSEVEEVRALRRKAFRAMKSLVGVQHKADVTREFRESFHRYEGLLSCEAQLTSLCEVSLLPNGGTRTVDHNDMDDLAHQILREEFEQVPPEVTYVQAYCLQSHVDRFVIVFAVDDHSNTLGVTYTTDATAGDLSEFRCHIKNAIAAVLHVIQLRSSN